MIHMHKLMHFYRALIVRDVRKIFRQRDRLASAMVRPFLWLWIIGSGMSALAGDDYITRLVPGIVAMTILFGAMIGGMSIALDKDAGTMRLLVTAPVSTIHLFFAKTVSAMVAGLVQASLLLTSLVIVECICDVIHLTGVSKVDINAVIPWAFHIALPQLDLLTLAGVTGGLSCAAIGLACGAWSRTIDGFAVMMNFVIFPVFFFSGALYPTQSMPALARYITQINPFTYAVDLFRHSWGLHPEYTVTGSMAYLLVSSVVILVFAKIRFDHGGTTVAIQASVKR